MHRFRFGGGLGGTRSLIFYLQLSMTEWFAVHGGQGHLPRSAWRGIRRLQLHQLEGCSNV